MPKVLKTVYNLMSGMTDSDGNVYQSASSLRAWWRMNDSTFEQPRYIGYTAGVFKDSTGNVNATVSHAGMPTTTPIPTFSPRDNPSSRFLGHGSPHFVEETHQLQAGSDAYWDALFGDGAGSTRQMTHALWMRVESCPGVSNKAIIFDHSGDIFGHVYENGQLRWYANWSGDASNAYWFVLNAFSLNKWVHLVWTYDANSISNDPVLYLDGQPVAVTRGSTVPSGSPPGIDGTWTHLRCGSTGASPLVGNITDVAIWNSLLSAEEVLAIYNSGVNGPALITSGYMSNPARVLLQDLDNRPGAYPNVGLSRSAIGGGHEEHGVSALWHGDITPFDDTRSINFEDPFARSTVVFNKLPRDARFIRLIDGEGTVTTFEFQRGVILRANSVPVDLTGRTKSMYRRRRTFLRRKIRNANRGSKYRRINTQKLKDRIWAEFSAERFAAAVNKDTIKIKARAEDNNVYLEQRIPGTVGNTIIYVMPPDATVTLPEAYTVVPFTGGINMDIVYPIGVQPQYSNLVQRNNPFVAAPNYVTASYGGVGKFASGSAIVAPGFVRKGIADASLAYVPPATTQEAAYSPFVDSAIILDVDDEFFDEGVSETLIQDFNSPLRDKVIIVIDINPVDDTQFGFTGNPAIDNTSKSSTSGVFTSRPAEMMVYYNFANRKWESLRGITSDVNEGADLSTQNLEQYETVIKTYPIGFSRGVELNCDGLKSACRPISTYGFPFHPQFHADGEKTLKMGDYIDAPFVFEKYVLEFSGSYSCGKQYGFISNMFVADEGRSGTGSDYNVRIDNGENWGEDPSADPNGSTGGNTSSWNPYYADRVPRAAINSFFILRQTPSANLNFEYSVEAIGVDTQGGSPSTGEVVSLNITGSIPGQYPITLNEPDKLTEVSTLRDLVTYGQWVCFNGGPSGSFLPQVPYTNITGALEQGLARELNTEDRGLTNPRISRNWDSGKERKYFFTQPAPTGSFIMKGKVKKPIALSGSFGTWYGFNNTPELQFNPSHPGNRYGFEGELSDARSLVRGVPGQRIVGTVQDMDYDHEDNALRGSFETRAVNVFEFEDTSPYILLPEDELILGWQSPMPFGVNRICSGMGSNAAGAQNNNAYSSYNLSGPNMGLHPGKGKLILYGSLIRDNKETLPNLHQNLTSDAIHEVIGNDPVFDEFDVEASPAFYGTMANELVTGSMKPRDFGQGNRAARGVAKTFTGGTMGVSGSLRRVMMHIDAIERYYDTLVGNPALYHQVDGRPIIKNMSLGGAAVEGGILLGMPGQTFTSYAVERDAIDTRWINAFPYEAYYASVDRLSALNEFDTKIRSIGDQAEGDSWNTDPPPPRGLTKVLSLFFDPSDEGGNAFMVTDEAGHSNLPTARREILNFYFGIGDGPQGMPNWRFRDLSAKKIVPVIRGFKYGVLNSSPQNTNAMFRRDRYGQFRDMMEQRRDARFFNDGDERRETGRTKGLKRASIQIKFINAETGDLELPENTHCQNLSTFATSSLPYFDGEMRDRTTDPDENDDIVVTN